MASTGTLTTDATPSSTAAWAGGNGVFSLTGTLKATTNHQPIVIVLQSDHSGDWEDMAGVYDIDENKLVYVPASNIRIRSRGADASTSVVGHFNS